MDDKKQKAAKKNSQAHILKVAGELFLRDGFGRASVDKMAAAARVSKQSIYEHFPSKADLFEAAVRDSLKRARMASIDPSDDVTDTLRRYMLHMFQVFGLPIPFGLFRANIAAARSFPKLAADLHQIRLDASAPVAAYLDLQIAKGKIIPCDTAVLATRFGGVAVGGTRYFLGRSLPSPKIQENIVDGVLELFFNGYSDQCEWGAEVVPPLQSTPPRLEGGVALRLSVERLNALIDSAMNNFFEFGYVKTSVDRIAQEQGVSKATIYRQFGSKAKLFRYVVERDIYEADQGEIVLPLHAESLEDTLYFIARQALDLHLAVPNIKMHQLLIEEAEEFPDLARQFYDIRVERLGRALAKAYKLHGLEAPGPFGTQVFYSLSTFAVRYFTINALPDTERRDVLSRSCAQLFSKGIGAR